MNRFVKLFCLLGLLLYPASYALAWCSGGCTCCRCPGEAQCLGSHSSCEAACGLVSERSRGGSAPSYDYGAAQRAQEAAAAAEAERQRQVEAERIERERRAEEKRQKDAAFIRDRDAAANTLKGSTGSAMGQLKGLAGADSSGLKGSGFDSGSELKGLRGSDHANQKASSKPVPHTDTSVVDARNVPSGLPKLLDDAIPRTASGNRVRKGFQAIQAGNWKAALAWFQEASKKEPNNPGIERLVDLAKFTLEYRKSAPMAVEKNTANSTVAAAAKLKEPDVQSGDNANARAAASQMAARARADAAFKQYVAKHGGGDRYSPDRNKAVQRAYRGEGYSDEELKAQLAKALQEYRENYRKLYPNGPPAGVGGNPAAEEISLGGKG